MNAYEPLEFFQSRMRSSELAAIAKITSKALSSLQAYATGEHFIQLLPVMISPFTDPLNHSVYPATISYEGRHLQLTASMIFHKQLALNLRGVDRIFIISPNVRLEKSAVKSSTNHLIEFSQFDFEMRDASMHDVISFLDAMLRKVFEHLRDTCATELSLLNRSLPIFDEPFPVFSSEELFEKYGAEFENRISEVSTTPCFVTNFKREFYDRETPEARGHYNNFDLIYPEGYGEGLSGAEREFEYEQILYRMNELKMDKGPFEHYLEAAKRHYIPRSAGAGIGIQRLIKFVCGRREIRDIGLFDRSIQSEFLF